MDITVKQNGAVFPKDVIVGHEGENNAKLLNISIPAIVDDNINLSILNVRIEIILSDGPVYTPIISKTYQDSKFLLTYNITDNILTDEKGYFDAQIVAFSEDNQIKWASDIFKIKVERSVNATKAAPDYIAKTYDDLKALFNQTTVQAELAEDSASSAAISSDIASQSAGTATAAANTATERAIEILSSSSDNIVQGDTHLFITPEEKAKLTGKLELIEKIIVGYTVTTSQPADWTTNWTSYYTNTGTAISPVYTAVGDASVPTWQANTYYSYSPDGVIEVIRYKDTLGNDYNFKAFADRLLVPAVISGAGLFSRRVFNMGSIYSPSVIIGGGSRGGSSVGAVNSLNFYAYPLLGHWKSILNYTSPADTIPYYNGADYSPSAYPKFSVEEYPAIKAYKLACNGATVIPSLTEIEIWGIRA